MQHEKHNHTENRHVSLKSALLKRPRRENKNRLVFFLFPWNQTMSVLHVLDIKQLSAGLHWTGSYLQCCSLKPEHGGGVGASERPDWSAVTRCFLIGTKTTRTDSK